MSTQPTAPTEDLENFDARVVEEPEDVEAQNDDHRQPKRLDDPLYEATIEEHFNTTDDDGNDFTLYQIRVKSMQTGRVWYIFRRYSEFLNLWTEITEAYPNIKEKYQFPQKSWYYKFHDSTVQQRAQKFQELLNLLISTDPYCYSNALAQFIKYDVKMLQKALNHYRARLYALTQAQKAWPSEQKAKKAHELDVAQRMIRELSSTVDKEMQAASAANLGRLRSNSSGGITSASGEQRTRAMTMPVTTSTHSS